jgi:hypothetical protein
MVRETILFGLKTSQGFFSYAVDPVVAGRRNGTVPLAAALVDGTR